MRETRDTSGGEVRATEAARLTARASSPRVLVLATARVAIPLHPSPTVYTIYEEEQR